MGGSAKHRSEAWRGLERKDRNNTLTHKAEEAYHIAAVGARSSNHKMALLLKIDAKIAQAAAEQ